MCYSDRIHRAFCALFGAVLQTKRFEGGLTLLWKKKKLFPKILSSLRLTKIWQRAFTTMYAHDSRRSQTAIIMAYSHVAHDCVLKDHIIIGNASQIAGEVEIDDFAIVSGGSLVHQFTRISKHVMGQGGSRIGKDIPPYTLIGRDPIVYCGINIVGLRRRGFTNQQVFLIQDIYRTLYTRGLNNTEALKAIETEYEPSEERDLILNFIKSSSRGIVRGSIDE